MSVADWFTSPKDEQPDPFRIGYVTGFTSGDQVVKVRFSGETTPVACNMVSSFLPYNGVKVLCARTGKSYTILDYVDTKPMQGLQFATSELSKTNNLTLSNIPGLAFYVEANAVYEVEARIHYTGTGAATDIKIQWSFPTGGSWLRQCNGLGVGTTGADNGTVRNSSHHMTTAVPYGNLSTTSYLQAIEYGFMYTGDAGVIQAQAAQNTSAAETLTVRTSSSVKWKRIS